MLAVRIFRYWLVCLLCIVDPIVKSSADASGPKTGMVSDCYIRKYLKRPVLKEREWIRGRITIFRVCL